MKAEGGSCLGENWVVLEALIPKGQRSGRGRRLLYAKKSGKSEHRWVMGELRISEEGGGAADTVVFRCVVPTASGRKEIVLNLRREGG